MKRQCTHTFEEIIGLENLCAAWREFIKGKRAKQDVLEFERNLADHLLDLSRISEQEAEQIKKDPRFDLIAKLSDERDKLFDAKNLQEMDEALARVVELMKQVLRFSPGEIEMRVIKMLKSDERRKQELVDDIVRELKLECKTPEEQRALDGMNELIFGTSGTKQREHGREAEVIRPDFQGRKK